MRTDIPILTAPVLIDACWAWSNFPTLAVDHSPWQRRRWLLQDSQMAQTANSIRMTCSANEQGSGAILLPVVRDWNDYQTLEVDFAFDGEPLLFLISVRDGKRLPPELPRFDLWRRYPPGRHHVRIDLDELRRGGNFPPIDLKKVQSLHLVAYDDQQREIDLYQLKLSRSPPDL